MWLAGFMTEIREAIQQAAAVLGVLARVDRSTLADSDLVSLLEAEEALGRLADACRVLTAAEVADRSRYELGVAGLSMQYSQRRAVDFIEQRTRTSKAEAGRRIRIGAALRARQSLAGGMLPPVRPILAEALTQGLVGVHSAHMIIHHLGQATGGSDATPANMDAAELALVGLAATNPAEDVADLARRWREGLDPDGAEPRYDQIVQSRLVRVSREQGGITRYTIDAAPPLAAVLQAALTDSIDPKAGPRFLSDDDQARATTQIVERDGIKVERLTDPRSLGQKQYDILEAVFTAGLAATRDQAANQRTVGMVTAIIGLKDLLDSTGYGILEGIDEVIPATIIQQLACETGFEPIIIGNQGQPLYHGTRIRYITPSQRRALIARDGDRCTAKGCRKRAATAHGHHVIFASRQGPTNIDNMVLLCPTHHAALHQGAFEIQMIDGMPWIRDSIDTTNNHAWKPASNTRLFLRPA